MNENKTQSYETNMLSCKHNKPMKRTCEFQPADEWFQTQM